MKRVLVIILFHLIAIKGNCQDNEVNGLWVVKIEKLKYHSVKINYRKIYSLTYPIFSQVFIKDSLIYFRTIPNYYDQLENELISKKEKNQKIVTRREYKNDDWDSIPLKLINKKNVLYVLNSSDANYSIRILGTFKKGAIYHKSKSRLYNKWMPFNTNMVRRKWIFTKIEQNNYDSKTTIFLEK